MLKLPAHVITYLTLALCLFDEDDYTEVATKVTGSLDRPTATVSAPGRIGISRPTRTPAVYAPSAKIVVVMCGPFYGPVCRRAYLDVHTGEVLPRLVWH